MGNRLSFKFKLIGLCVLLSSLSVLVGGISTFGLGEVEEDYERVTSKVLPNIEYTDQMFLSYQKVRIDLRTLGLPNLSKADAQKAIAGVLEAIAKYEATNKKYMAVPFVDGEDALYTDVNEAWKSFKAVGERALKLYASGTEEDLAKLSEIFLVECPEKAKVYADAIEALLGFHQKNSETWVNQARESARSTNQTNTFVIIGGVLFGLGLGYFFATRISHSIATVTHSLAQGAEQVSDAASQISSSAQTLSESSTHQASSLEETVATMEELTAMVKLNSDNARQAAELSSQTRDVALKGENQIQNLIKSIEVISSDSKKIADITSVIDDIAFQTNLLALNASVEAARAGEQGKGFAVVADAVRSLAQRSAQSAKDISALISSSVERIGNGAVQAQQSGEVLAEIVTSVKKVSELNSEISAASQEQSNGILQIGKAMNQLDQITQANAAASEESASASEELSAQAGVLRGNVVSLVQIVGESKAA